MANLEELGKILSLYMKKMELELTCPSCSIILRQPTLLPCTHVVCSQCITAKNEYQYECPICIKTLLLGDIRPFTQIENMIYIFRSLDDAMVSNGKKLDPQCIAGMKVPFHVSDHKTDGNAQGSQVDISSIKVPTVESPLSGQSNSKENSQDGNNCTKEKWKEELTGNIFGGLPNNLQPHPPLSGVLTRNIPRGGGGSGKLATFDRNSCANNAGKDTCINLEEPSTPPSIHGSKNPEANKDHGTERLPIKKSEAGTCAKTQVARFPFMDLSTGEVQYFRKSDDAKSHIPASASKTDDDDDDDDDDVREVKRQKLKNEHGSDCNNKPAGTSDHAYVEGTEKCAFCHLSEINKFTGPMLHYAHGKPAGPEEVNPSNVKHFHEKCFEWAPQAFFEGEIAKNMESELVRASKIKCSKCGVKGAALGCYVKSCWRSYHVPCAIELPDCRWDCENFNLLCPTHSSCKFRHETVELKWTIKAKRSSLLQIKSKTRKMTKTKWSSAQIDKSSIPGQLASRTEDLYDELWIAEPDACSDWVLCGSDLSESEMVFLKEFANLTGASVTGMWKPNVTHVIASTDEHGACSRSRKVLMAILNGKWVLTLQWVNASMAARSPVSEEAYEISLDCYGIANGPKKGRLRAIQEAPKIFSGLSFYFSAQFETPYRVFLEEILQAAGGTVLKNVYIEGLNSKVFSPRSSFIVYNEDPPQTCDLIDLAEIVRKRCDEVGALEAKTGFKVIGHMQLLDNIAACNSAADLEKAAVK